MNKEITKEMFAMNEAINDMLRYSETVAQLSTLAKLQEHFIKLNDLLKG